MMVAFAFVCGAAGAQESSAMGAGSGTAQVLAEEPVPRNHPPLAPNGGPEGSNAVPQLRQTIADQSDDQENPAMFRSHLIARRFWISGQSNFIFQAHTPFHSPYSGPNSFHGYGESAASVANTVYLGVRPLRFSEVSASLDVEDGRGLSDALGIAAYPNADVIDPDLTNALYLSRLFLHHTIPVAADRINQDPNPFFLQPWIPRQRFEVFFGKLSLLDYFDVNEVGSDPHLQFTNLAIGNAGTYEYAGDGHGYTIASMVSYSGPRYGLRFAEALLPKTTNTNRLEYNLRNSREENIEFDCTTYPLRGYVTHTRALVFINHADLGNYREADEAYLAGVDPTPDITLHRHPGTVKPGFDISLEQDLPKNFRAYFRYGWNHGLYESFTFSEMNDTVSFGADLSGDAWHRKYDRIGSAFVNSGLAYYHREYLALGGIGFMLDDGRLNYGRESVSETYYAAHVFGGLYLAAQLSFVNNPGFNRDRGPVVVPGLRAHIDF
ncbi:MAG TPA: carbohydrate porin [Silvibacterium sp.]|nr:carbohydrate porin [Silvibacterium sp.]